MKVANALLLLALASSCYGQAPQVAEKNAPWKTVIAQKNEPGERLLVTGTVYGPDGATPLQGVSIYVYHTDSKGYYPDNANPRLRGYMRTNAEGKYEYETIKPAPYPSAQAPAHIHYVVVAPGYQQKVFEIVFEGDPFINERIRADARREDSAYSIRRLERDQQGALKCAQDIRLKRE